MRQPGGYGRAMLAAILLVLCGCAVGPATQESTPLATAAPSLPTAALTAEPTAQPMPTQEATGAPAATTPVSQNPDDYYDDYPAPAAAEPSEPEPTEAGPESTVALAHSADHAMHLVGPDGMTLYTFTRDRPGVSNCSGACAEAWPPLTLAMGEMPVAGAGANGTLDVIERDDGSWQVTYDDRPLYYFVGDTTPGQTNGTTVQYWALATP